jgi:RNA polymerase sigma factor (sigma-70 family)
MYDFDELEVAELRKKDPAALRQLYKTHYPMVLNLVLTNSGNEQEAKDVYQEAIIHFYERLQQAEFVLVCKIKTYIYAVSKRLWLKRLAEQKKQIRMEMEDGFAGIEQEMFDLESKEKNFQAMDKALYTLGEPCRTIVEDYYLHNLTMNEITEKFGYTNADNAKNQKYKCLQRLKRIFFEGIKGK